MGADRPSGPQELRASAIIGGTCAACGFSYQAYHGHLEPCPRCAVLRLAEMLARLLMEIDHSRGQIGMHPADLLLAEIMAGYPRRM